MGLEIERKFLIKNDNWKREGLESHKIAQGYLNSNPERTVRVRIQDDKGIITIKGKVEGLTRLEFEYEIPYDEAVEMMALCEGAIISKTRYKIKQDNLIWEIDEFIGDNDGLLVAEIELIDENQTFDKPDWLGEEVSTDVKYYNSSLSTNPYKNWNK